MKNIEWLKEEVQKLPVKYYGFNILRHEDEYMVDKDEVIRLIDQIDEPEVLSQELPSIPRFVAEWYESEGKRSSWWNWFYKWGRDEGRTELETKTIRWMQDFNEELFVDMFLHGYTVKKEQKYYVILEENSYGAMGLGIDREGRLTFTATHDKWSLPKLTEQEIKDYDERFWPFAVKVEELE